MSSSRIASYQLHERRLDADPLCRKPRCPRLVFSGGFGHLCCSSATSELVEVNSPLLKKPSTKLRVNSLYPPAATHCLPLWTGPGRRRTASIHYFKNILFLLGTERSAHITVILAREHGFLCRVKAFVRSFTSDLLK